MAEHYPCLLLLNDLHISKDDIPAFVDNWQEALGICRDRGIHHMVVGGDLFLSRTAQTLEVLLAVRTALLDAAAADIYVTLAEGNHDKVDQEALTGYCHIFDQHPNVTVVAQDIILEDPTWDFILHVMSYFPECGSFLKRLEKLETREHEASRKRYLYIHEGIRGALAQPTETELPAAAFKDFDRVFVGHYHNRTVIKGTPIEYIGAARQHNFGEDEAKGYTVLYTDGRHEFIENKVNIRYRVLDVQAQQVGNNLMDMLTEHRDLARCRIKVRVHGDAACLAAVDRQRLLQAGAAKVELLTPDTQALAAPEEGVLEKFDSGKLRAAYEAFCAQKRVEDPRLGLSYLQKIESSCGN